MTTSLPFARQRHGTIPGADQARVGLLCGLSAYLTWGAVPLYFKLVAQVPAIVVLSHRIVWSLVFLAIVTTIRRSWGEIRTAVLTRTHLTALLLSTILISINWYSFIYTVETNQVLQASLGYFINPLISVLLGVVVMGERLRNWQTIGLVLASAGVVTLTLCQGIVPWLALVIAVSFGLYGLMRKTMHTSAMAGLTVETGILFIPSLAIIALTGIRGAPSGQSIANMETCVLLVLSGIVTTVPLLLFAAAARRLRLSTMGFMQYISPTSQFLLAVFLFDEPFTPAHLVSFGLIWAALVMYSMDSYYAFRNRRATSLAAAQSIDDGAEPTA